MMYTHLGRPQLEKQITDVVRECLLGDLITPELGGKLTTKQVGDAVLARL